MVNRTKTDRRRIRQIVYGVLVLAIGVMLNGCGGKKALRFNVICASDSNQENTVVAWIYQLQDTQKFMSETREALIRNGEEVLSDAIPGGAQVIKKQLAPGDSIGQTYQRGKSNRADIIELSKETKYIGVVADFVNPDPDKWRRFFEVKPNLGKKFKLNVHIRKRAIAIEEPKK